MKILRLTLPPLLPRDPLLRKICVSGLVVLLIVLGVVYISFSTTESWEFKGQRGLFQQRNIKSDTHGGGRGKEALRGGIRDET